MNFLNKQEYTTKRDQAMNEVKNLMDENKLEESESKMQEVEDLDNQWSEDAKEMANKAALENKFSGLNANNITNRSSARAGKEGGTMDNIIVTDALNNMDYRRAFMNHVLKGDAIPMELLNVDANTKTTDATVMIPTVVLEKIIEKMEATGMILPLITKTAYKGGLAVPTSSVKPVASWVAEGAGSDKQKKTTGSIVFAYHKLRCAVSVSIETDTMALPVFETTLISNVAEAMTKSLEQAIINGDGIGKPKGILKETAPDGQNIDIAKAGSITYDVLIQAEAALPLAYEADAIWAMTKKTFMQFIGMVDSQKQPIARVNYGINGKPERTLLGRTVILNDYMDAYAAAPGADITPAFLFNFKDYVLNTNMNITVTKYVDNDTDDTVTKAVMLVDGKVVDKNSLVTITKKSV